MELLARSFDDILIDRIKSALSSFAVEQAALDPLVNYKTERDRTAPLDKKDLPHVNVWADGNSPESRGSSARTHSGETVTVNIDCVAGAKTDDAEVPYGADAMARLLYLKAQARFALYRLIHADFGFPPGVIASKSWPSWSLYKDEAGNPEETIIGGRWTFTITSSWDVEDISGVLLEEIAIDTGRFSTLYPFNRATASGTISISGDAIATSGGIE